MNNLIWIGAIFVAATFLVTNTPNTTMAYSCSSSSSTHNISPGSQLGVSGSSGSCATSSSASTRSPFRVDGFSVSGGSAEGNAHASCIRCTPQTSASAASFAGPSSGEAASSASAGGGQSSCSSSSGGGGLDPSGQIPIAKTTASSNSQPGRCP
jgi:hypothetical protein